MKVRNQKVMEAVRRQPCCVCGLGPPSDPSHIRSVGAGGPDEDWNLLPMCRVDHSLWHGMGWFSFVSVYPVVRARLEKMGWEITVNVNFRPLLTHPNLIAGTKSNS